MGVQNLTPGIQTISWNASSGLVAPEWQWFWEKDLRVVAPFWIGGQVRDLSLFGNHGTLGNGAVWSTGQYGRVIDFGTTSQGRAVDFGSAASLDDITPLTVVVLVKVRSVSSNDNDQRIVMKGGTDVGWMLMPWNLDTAAPGDGTADCFVFTAGSSATNWAVHSSANSIKLGEWQVVAAYLRVAVGSSPTNVDTDKAIWVDGVRDTIHSVSDALRTTDAAIDMIAGEETVAGDDEPLDGQIGAIYIIRGSLTDSQHKQLAQDIYGPVRPDFRVIGKALAAAITAALTGTTVPTVTEAEMVAG